MTTEFNLSEKRNKFIEDMNYALSKFDWGNSFLDAEAINILNTWRKTLIKQDKEFIRLLKEKLEDFKIRWACNEISFDELDILMKSEIDKLAGEKLI